MINKSCVAMLLAGGRGTRLKELTDTIAKPAVPFGGKYRIIDFTLSNCKNSGIDVVGVLTQYHPHVLQNYISSGEAWDLKKKDGGLNILPPYQCQIGERWYEGTAHAIYQNMHFIEQYDPEHVLVISGDHIYKMDYNLMLKQHIKSKSDATISVMEVPWDEASRFGIMNIHEDSNRIMEFEEKPKNPASNLASMGIYIFNWKVLKGYLEKEEKNELSSKDFGKNIIPAMLNDNLKLHAYNFNGYWKDVGTVESLWEANMDLLNKETNIFLNDKEWSIYTKEQTNHPQFIAESAVTKQSIISEGCEVYGEVDHSVLFNNVTVGENASIKDSVILPGARIGENVTIENAIIGENVLIPNGTVIKGTAYDNIILVGKSIEEEVRLSYLI